MNLRDLKPATLKQISTECRDTFRDWLKTTDGKMFKENPDGMMEKVPAAYQDVWDRAFTYGAKAILRRVDAIKDKD